MSQIQLKSLNKSCSRDRLGFEMLSAFSKIDLVSTNLVLKPLKINNLLINELIEEDFLFYFDEDAADINSNAYFSIAMLKIPLSMNMAFESRSNYVNTQLKLFCY